MRLRIGTYNIHKCAGMDQRVSAARIAEVIAEFHPDVVGLQEVLSVESGRREENQARYLADALGMHLAVGEVRRLRGGAYGNIVLSRLPIQSSCTFDLTVAGYERRGCLRTDIELGGGELLHVFNLHLGTGFLERRAQAQRIVATEWLRGAGPPGPRVALGDFNEWTHGLASRVLAAEFRSADIRLHLKFKRTYPGFFPLLHLDHIYYDADLVLERACLHRTLKSLVASDHLPLYADFALREADGSPEAVG